MRQIADKNGLWYASILYIQNQFVRFFKSSLVLVSISLLLFLLEFFIPLEYSMLTNRLFNGKELINLIFFIFCSFLFFFMIPILLTKYLYQKKLSELGLWLPKNKIIPLLLTAIGLALLIPAILSIARFPQVQSYYSLNHVGFIKFLFIIFIIFPLYYLFEEFFFRGFIFLNLYSKIGKHAYWISDLIFTFAHANKPYSEIVLALPAGIIFAYITLKTKSIYPSMFVHYCMGVSLLVYVNH